VTAARQPALPLFGGPRYDAAAFREAPSNAEAVTWLARTGDWPDGRLALWGVAGCGKTHLLHIWASRFGAAIWSGAGLHGLPELPRRGIALDDADEATDEAALFHLLNAASEARLPLLLASRIAPARWQVTLPDLASRLRAITAVQIGAPDDALLGALLPRLLADRLIRLPEPVLNWLLEHLPRTAAALNEAVARLDAVSLEHHRDITLPMVRAVLADLLSVEPDEFSGTGTPPSRDDPRLL
jgi:chromosomal replication initiation ATPase DnaA